MLTTVINNKVYDITSFADNGKHPGGKHMIELAIGRDSTYMFWSYHLDQKKATRYLESLPCLGEVELDQRVTYYKPDFLFSLQKKILTYLSENSLERRGGLYHRLFFWVPLAAIFTYLVSFCGYWSLSPVLGLVLASFGLCIQHDANHGAFSTNSKFNKYFGYFDDIIGGSSFMWRYQHNVGHHITPNDYNNDPDSSSGDPFLRLNNDAKIYLWNNYQYLYWPILFVSVGPGYFFGDFYNFAMNRYNNVKIYYIGIWDYLEFFFFKILHFSIFFIVPYYRFGQWYSFMLMHIVGGYYLAIQFVISHNTSDIISGRVQTDDWAIMQISESSNWSTKSKVINFFTGGLNQQIEHHLFPSLCDKLYPEISNIVENECKMMGIPYHSYPDFYSNFISFLKCVKIMGKCKRVV